MKNWKIYIVGHKKIYDEMIQGDKKFNNDNYCFLNVGAAEKLDNDEKYICINQRDLPNAVMLGRQWAESEGIYNIWRSGIYNGLDYIGFLHYDKEFKLIRRFCLGGRTNITERIEKYISGRERAHISFENHGTRWDYDQNIMMDITRPEEISGDGANCYHEILKDYNSYFKRNYKLEDFFGYQNINLCSCFLIDVYGFEKMMGFFDWLVKSHKLDIYDREHKHRFQGNMAERYFGMFMLFEYDKSLDLSLIHHYDRGWK